MLSRTRSLAGSSPRLRGTPNHPFRRAGLHRFIPAPAGNTRGSRLRNRRKTVHPRACGEHDVENAGGRGNIGSSPRLRGTHKFVLWSWGNPRFIPAPAGNTVMPGAPPLAGSVHPRACGEHFNCFFSSLFRAGSSPRLRGTLASDEPVGEFFRFIPAPAGNTSMTLCGIKGCAVHPRACGEHMMTRRGPILTVGSSPRLRGTRFFVGRRGVGHRFIPAPAGNTDFEQRPLYHPSVHPRACGEHPFPAADLHTALGSSPRLRGTQW